MKKLKVFRLLTMTVTFLALVPVRECHIPGSPTESRPLCAAQFSIVNYVCSSLPFVRRPPSLPAHSDDDEEHGHNGGRHRHHDRRWENSDHEESCCRWAKAVNSQCVCELLLLFRLPTFLMRSSHQYTLAIGESCEVTYSCGSFI
ncbi:hypothetical protein QN277_012667 [Acacia crassicarpa]|uniref:Secreted protein n=1 Tax=Acacia crassicarpa TaxID=499986 RepID=A0AAE1N1K6_9FABA|nr:hypothetical protein QN277_012667 [Acacia crassicarpa]